MRIKISDIEGCEYCYFADTCPFTSDSVILRYPTTKNEENMEKNECNYLYDFDDIGIDLVDGCGGKDGDEWAWRGISYRRYTQSSLDFVYDEYANGDWHWT